MLLLLAAGASSSAFGELTVEQMNDWEAKSFVENVVKDFHSLRSPESAKRIYGMLYPKAIPQYNVGYGKFKERMNDIETKAPGLFFAGHFRDGVSLGDSIVSGRNAASRVENFCQ